MSETTTTRPPLRRPREGRIVGGVAAGIAAHLGVDVALVRIVLVLATLVTWGFGALVYLAAMIFIPEDGTVSGSAGEAAPGQAAPAAPPSALRGRDPMVWVGIGLLVVGAVWLLNSPWMGWGFHQWWPLVLIGFGLALWRSGSPASPRASAPPSGPTTPGAGTSAGWAPPAGTTGTGWAPPAQPAGPVAAPFTPLATAPTPPSASSEGDDAMTQASTVLAEPDAPSSGVAPDAGDGPGAGGGVGTLSPPSSHGAWTPPGGEAPPQPPGGAGAPPSGPYGPPPSWAPPPPPVRERSLLGRLTAGLAAMTAGVLWLLDLTGVVDVSGTQMVAAALLVVGLGLLVGAIVGRGRWLILPGLLLGSVVLASLVLRPLGLVPLTWIDLRDGGGDVTVTPLRMEDLAEEYRLAAGELRVDLRQLDIDAPTATNVEVGVGDVLIQLPAHARADVRVRVGAGQVRLDGSEMRGGLGVDWHGVVERGDGSPTLTLDVQLGAGRVRVQTSGPGSTGTWIVPGSTLRGEPSAPLSPAPPTPPAPPVPPASPIEPAVPASPAPLTAPAPLGGLVPLAVPATSAPAVPALPAALAA